MAIKFVRPCQQGSLYNPGEIAAFEKDVEERLIKQGFAEAVKAPAAQVKADAKVDAATQPAK